MDAWRAFVWHVLLGKMLGNALGPRTQISLPVLRAEITGDTGQFFLIESIGFYLNWFVQFNLTIWANLKLTSFSLEFKFVLCYKWSNHRLKLWDCSSGSKNRLSLRPKIFWISCSFSQNLAKWCWRPPGGLAPPPTRNPGSTPGLSGKFKLFKKLFKLAQFVKFELALI